MLLEGFVLFDAQNITTGAASAATALTSGAIVRVNNLSSTAAEIVYARLGGPGVTVTVANGVAIMPGQTLYLSRQDSPFRASNPGNVGQVTHIATIAGSGTPIVNVATGTGAP